MNASDAAYLRLRAERERKLAEEAPNPAAAAAHRTMADAYESRLQLAAVRRADGVKTKLIEDGGCADAPAG